MQLIPITVRKVAVVVLLVLAIALGGFAVWLRTTGHYVTFTESVVDR